MPVAVVTGGSMGLGRAVVAGLLGEGWSVVTDARDGEALTATANVLAERTGSGSGAALIALAGDVGDAGHRGRLVCAADGLGGLDLLVNNASSLGPSPLPPLVSYPLDALKAVFDTNLVAPLALIQAAAPLLRRAARPTVINITSDASVGAYPGWGGYGSSKAAIDLLSAVLAEEEPSWRVWAVDPGDLRTQMHQDAFPGEDISDRPEPESVVGAFLSLVSSDRPSGRVRLSDITASPALEGDRR
jgi:NAD(P)-dependent dehydrogenase (short-subunit alcohol dehydrogenase family)